MDTTSFYDDMHSKNGDSVKMLKRNMTLDFNGSQLTKKQKLMGGLLNSPDLNLLKLGSPELERMIIQQNGMVTTTPTPTQFIYPKNVTEEQEAYARGFVDALAELHTKTSGEPVMTTGSDPIVSMVSMPATSTLTELQPMRTTTSLPGSSMMSAPVHSQPMPVTTAPSSYYTGYNGSPANLQLTHLKEEPQTVPCLGSTPPLSPINMESQEIIKLERKRARNRVAARKCRTRKLERISRLEDRVKELKGQNSDLTATASSLREQVFRLKQQIMDHVNSGCQVMTHNIAL